MKTIARIGAVAFIAIAITMTAIEMRDARTPVAEPVAISATARERDPFRGALIRCQAIGQAGATDAACLRAWAENRRRFLAPGARPRERLPDQVDAAEVANQPADEPMAIAKSSASAPGEEH
ncbi:MAG: putative entry exclusion protein TrbK-alt [Sphingomonas sp.]|jgi:conjugative transfer region protein TrbK|uniref:putative entry exclusion protein TrbK-alt n=1 Tax=Sphingomonas sp. TaxID=28214 RepID=UPI0035669AA0